MKRWLAYLFLVIFSFQALPVKAIGKLLAKNQMTEEVKSDCDEGNTNSTDDDSLERLKDLCVHNHIPPGLATALIGLKADAQHHGEEDLPNSHIRDIHCPPPNC